MAACLLLVKGDNLVKYLLTSFVGDDELICDNDEFICGDGDWIGLEEMGMLVDVLKERRWGIN